MTRSNTVVAIIDDDAAMRTALIDLLESVGLQTRAYGSGHEFVQAMDPDSPPCCLILDVRLPGTSGLEFQQELKAANIDIPIIFITGHGDIPMTVQAMRAGAVDFLAKPFREQALLDAINRAIERGRIGREKQAEITELRKRADELTPREREVMLLVIRGLLNKQIAAELGTSETTVKVHRGQVMRKMQADSLPDLVRMVEKLSLP
ncbi:MAG TPA: response regulator transcription factor [Pirellulales bacterium]|nr:response regulator transcription factor [Pirellulales bacterium]